MTTLAVTLLGALNFHSAVNFDSNPMRSALALCIEGTGVQKVSEIIYDLDKVKWLPMIGNHTYLI